MYVIYVRTYGYLYSVCSICTYVHVNEWRSDRIRVEYVCVCMYVCTVCNVYRYLYMKVNMICISNRNVRIKRMSMAYVCCSMYIYAYVCTVYKCA